MTPSPGRSAYTIPLPPRRAKDLAPPIELVTWLLVPCPFLPGTFEKIGVMAARHTAGLPIAVAGDARLSDRHGYLPADGAGIATVAYQGFAGKLQPIGAAKGPRSKAKPLDGEALIRAILGRHGDGVKTLAG